MNRYTLPLCAVASFAAIVRSYMGAFSIISCDYLMCR